MPSISQRFAERRGEGRAALIPYVTSGFPSRSATVDVLTALAEADIAEGIYRDLVAAGVETLYDDRGEKAGSAFNDADLIGCPLRLIISPKTVAEGQAEFKTRDGSRHEMIALADTVAFIRECIGQ